MSVFDWISAGLCVLGLAVEAIKGKRPAASYKDRVKEIYARPPTH